MFYHSSLFLLSLLTFQIPLFREGRGGSSSKFSLHTSRSSTTSFISLRLSPKRFHPRPSMWLSHFGLGRPTGLLPLRMANRACFGSLFWGILLTRPNHLNYDLSMWRSSDSTFSELWISELETLSSKITLFILCKNLISDACTCDCILSVITQDSCP